MKKKMVAIFLCLSIMGVTGCNTSTPANNAASTAPESEAPATDSVAATEEPAPAETTEPTDTTETADSTADNTGIMGVKYAEQSDTQTLDIYLPKDEADAPYPVIVAVHGGSFFEGDSKSSDISPVFAAVDHGYAVVSVNYRLADEAVFPAAVNDIKAAIRYVKANADTYHFDAEKIAVWGDSAGANLAAMAGVTGDMEAVGENDNKENLDYSSNVQVVIDWFAPTDFMAMGVTGVGMLAKYLGQDMYNNDDQKKMASPITYVGDLKPDTAPAFFIQHGTADILVSYEQAEDFNTQLTAQLGEDKVTFEPIENVGHGAPEFYTEENMNKVYAFLDQHLKAQ